MLYQDMAGLAPGERIDPGAKAAIETYVALVVAGQLDDAAKVLALVCERAARIRGQRDRARLDVLAERVHGRVWVLRAAEERRVRGAFAWLRTRVDAMGASRV